VDVDDRRQLVLIGQLDEQPHDLTRRLGVEAGRGLVDEQDVGVLQEGAGDADALALPAGELVGALVELVGDPDALEELVGAVDGARREAPEPTAPEAYVAELAGEDVLHHGQAVDERELLEDHPDAAPFEPQPPAGEAREVDTLELHGAGGWLDEAVHAADQRALAGPRRADEGHDLPGRHAQVDPLQRDLAAAVLLDESGDLEDGGSFPLLADLGL